MKSAEEWGREIYLEVVKHNELVEVADFTRAMEEILPLIRQEAGMFTPKNKYYEEVSKLKDELEKLTTLKSSMHRDEQE